MRRLLARTRLLTLTGSGGCGKTRLCLQVAADSLERFPDGAWLVELAPLVRPGSCATDGGHRAGLKEAPGKPIRQTLTDYLKDKRLLLLLDNCEHLLDGCAQLADALLRQCPQVTILASSREALGIGWRAGVPRAFAVAARSEAGAHASRPSRPSRRCNCSPTGPCSPAPDFRGHRPERCHARFHLLSAGRDSAGHRVGGGKSALPFSRRDQSASWTSVSVLLTGAHARRCRASRRCAR